MKQTRKIVNSNKGLITFCLLLFFVTAGFAKSIASVFPSDVKSGTSKASLSKHALTAASDSDTELSFLDQLKDSDANDVEFAFFGNYTFPEFSAPVATAQNFAAFTSYTKTYSVPLYDLYCNWKFHLS